MPPDAVIERLRHAPRPELVRLTALPPGITTERQLQQLKGRFARSLGALYYHTQFSIHSPAGFPDDVTVAGSAIIISETKADSHRRLTDAQRAWLDALAAATTLVVCRRPVTPGSYPDWALAVLAGVADRPELLDTADTLTVRTLTPRPHGAPHVP